jgi:hypothetical protein
MDGTSEPFLQPQILNEMLEPSIRQSRPKRSKNSKSDKFPEISKIPEITSWSHPQSSSDALPLGMGLLSFRPATGPVPSVFPHRGYSHAIEQHAQLLRGPLGGHSGDGVGSSGYLLVAPGEGIAVSLLANQNACGGVLEEAALEMAAAVKRAARP